ncbi:MAG TPA: helix-turn-helix domain-containing protein [Nocardioides sp.]
MPDTPRPTLPELLDIPTIAEHLGVQPRHIRRLVHEKRIPYIKWGHLIRFDPEDIAAWLDINRRPQRSPR